MAMSANEEGIGKMLSDRQQLILNAIVDDYIRSAEPVGSRSISKRGDVAYSPATIRNEMSDLEEMGFLEQPHTSAGRIPSHKGYRYYVDHLVRMGFLHVGELSKLKEFFSQRLEQTERVVSQAANILSQLTSYTSIVLGPDPLHTTLKHLQLVPLSEQTAVIIMVTNTGTVESKTVTVPKDIHMSELERFINMFNHKLTGVPLLHLRSKLHTEIGSELGKYVHRYEELIKMMENVLSEENEERVLTSGMTQMLSQPEFKDVDKVRMILELFDETSNLVKIVPKNAEGIQVRIGTENPHEAMKNCSLITATYTIEGQSLGTIGILGPTRMDYGKVISLLDHLYGDMTSVFMRWNK